MSKKEYALGELLKSLITVKEVLGKGKRANALPKSYKNFSYRTVMSKKGYALGELLKSLVTVKEVLGKGKCAQVLNTTSSSRNPLKGGNQKRAGIVVISRRAVGV